MKASRILIGVGTALLLLGFHADAQELLQLKLQVKALSTNEAGRLVKQNINNETLLRDFADSNGITNLNSLALVYHVAGDERGDVIEIVDTTTGNLLSQVFGLLFPVDLPTGDGSQLSRFVYLYNDQQSVSMGSGMLRERIALTKQGNTNRTINGELQFYLLPDATNGLRMCTGTINASKLFSTNAPPGTNFFPRGTDVPQP
jgi:hypothetical protein